MFHLTKLPCHVPRVLDEKDCPPIGTEFSEEDYPKYFCSLYFPCDSSFNTPLSVEDWLASVFQHELPTSLFLATYSSAQIFTVCNLAERSFITLDPYDISSSFFHPHKYLPLFCLHPHHANSSCLVPLYTKALCSVIE